MRVADFIMHYLYDKAGIRNVYMLTGGGAMTLNDSVALHGKFNVICNHHEQACAMSAVGESKLTGMPTLVIPTTGCGGTNTITGLLDAWQDNLPVIFISGQAKTSETTHGFPVPLRQFGVQEADIITIVQSLTKYAVMLRKSEEILYHLEKALHLATSGRPGPVWLDIPLDIQNSKLPSDLAPAFAPKDITPTKEKATEEELERFIQLIENAERPIIIAGNGIRLGKAKEELDLFLKKNPIPTTASYLSVDLVPTDNELHIGRLGVKGDRAGNFAVQNADLIVVWGCRLSVALTGYDFASFGREAKVIVVDIDPNEHKKGTVRIDYLINADIKHFLQQLSSQMIRLRDIRQWKEKCLHWKKIWPVCSPTYHSERNGVNMYHFIEELANHLKPNSVIVSDAGSAYYVTSQAIRISEQQRYLTSGAQAEMGFTIPAAIGASMGKDRQEVVAITGDGSFQSNIQELQTIRHNKLPIKIFVWNNDGYLSIQATQTKFFEKRYIGTDSASGVSFPNTEKIAQAYGLLFVKITGVSDLAQGIEIAMQHNGPVLCEVICPKHQEVIPTLSSKKNEDGKMVSKPIEDMYPFLERQEFLREMIVRPMPE
ncbi:MAG: thiamine pyrophosphate-binding protein [Turneriella sp.]